jgi:predicted MFS family arabinose efflux permease
MIAMVVFGVGEVLGGPCMGYIVDKFGCKKAVLANAVIMIVTTASLLLFLIDFQLNWKAFIACFLWGF